MTGEPASDPDFLLNAALDGELDAAGTLAMERRLVAEPKLAARAAQLAALRAQMRQYAPREPAPEALRRRIAAMAQTPASGARPQRLPQLARLAAALALGLILGAGADRWLEANTSRDETSAVVANYIRSRLSGAPVDVASNDRHNVKPWLAGKIGAGATVADLSADGFALVGGRVDVIAATPVATLVYQLREHFIDVTQWPDPTHGPTQEKRDGFALLRWFDGAHSYVAVSDLPAAELAGFASAFQKAAARESEPK